MALIKCSECGKEISDKSKICIHCGCPIEKEGKIESKRKAGNNFSLMVISGIFLLLAIIIFIFLSYIVILDKELCLFALFGVVCLYLTVLFYSLGKRKKRFNIIYIFSIASIIGFGFSCMIFIVNWDYITDSWKNTEKNQITDANEIKALCIYDAYTYKKENGNTYKYLNGNTQVVSIEVNEKRSDSHTKYNCDKKKDEVYETLGVNATCKTDSKTATNGNRLYSYNLTYNYETQDNINKVISSLVEQEYKCFTYYNKDNSVVKEAIIGSWCGFDPIVEVDEKIIFNEDGTGKYYVGKYTEYDFYYSIDDKNIIYYNKGSDILDLAFNEEKNVIFDGMYLDSTTNEIIQDEKVNYTYSKCQ